MVAKATDDEIMDSLNGLRKMIDSIEYGDKLPCDCPGSVPCPYHTIA